MNARLMSRGLVVALAVVATAAAPVCAQLPGSRQTREFVQAAAQSDDFEIMEATTALAESRTAQVRAFAQAMIDAHRQTTEKLKLAVAKAGLAEPSPGLGGDQSAFLAALQSERGADFDRAYVRQQVLAHHAALAIEQGYASTGDDATVRETAAATIPIITEHLRMAERMMAAMGGS